MRNTGLAVFVAALMATATSAAECDMAFAFNQSDNGGDTLVAVWADEESLLFMQAVYVNTDGTRRSYSVDDFWGEDTAINNLCNAMSDACAGLSNDGLRQRRILTQEAKAEGWPAAKLAATKISPSIIPFRNGKPCPEADGFLVSATALTDPDIADQCDPARYVDALDVAAIVLPKRRNSGTPTKFEEHGIDVGDLTVVLSPSTGNLVYAVVGDKGPARELGEGTVALAGKLLGKTKPPVNYRQIRGKSPYQGQGWVVNKAAYLVFPETRDGSDPYMTVGRIEADAKDRFDDWGGAERLKACVEAYQAAN